MDVLNKIDYAKLREQKAILINMIQDWGEADDEGQREDAQKVEGLLPLLDSIQDYAVDILGKSEQDVFNFKKEE